MATLNEQIQTIRDNCAGDEYDIVAAVREWSNCQEIDVTPDGDIWVQDPQRGRYLNDAEKQEFIDWCSRQ